MSTMRAEYRKSGDVSMPFTSTMGYLVGAYLGSGVTAGMHPTSTKRQVALIGSPSPGRALVNSAHHWPCVKSSRRLRSALLTVLQSRRLKFVPRQLDS